MTWENQPQDRPRSLTPHTVRVNWTVAGPADPLPLETGWAVLSHAWIWTGGEHGRRIPDVRLVERGHIPAVRHPQTRGEIAQQLRLIAERLDRPA